MSEPELTDGLSERSEINGRLMIMRQICDLLAERARNDTLSIVSDMEKVNNGLKDKAAKLVKSKIKGLQGKIGRLSQTAATSGRSVYLPPSMIPVPAAAVPIVTPPSPSPIAPPINPIPPTNCCVWAVVAPDNNWGLATCQMACTVSAVKSIQSGEFGVVLQWWSAEGLCAANAQQYNSWSPGTTLPNNGDVSDPVAYLESCVLPPPPPPPPPIQPPPPPPPPIQPPPDCKLCVVTKQIGTALFQLFPVNTPDEAAGWLSTTAVQVLGFWPAGPMCEAALNWYRTAPQPGGWPPGTPTPPGRVNDPIAFFADCGPPPPPPPPIPQPPPVCCPAAPCPAPVVQCPPPVTNVTVLPPAISVVCGGQTVDVSVSQQQFQTQTQKQTVVIQPPTQPPPVSAGTDALERPVWIDSPAAFFWGHNAQAFRDQLWGFLGITEITEIATWHDLDALIGRVARATVADVELVTETPEYIA